MTPEHVGVAIALVNGAMAMLNFLVSRRIDRDLARRSAELAADARRNKEAARVNLENAIKNQLIFEVMTGADELPYTRVTRHP